MTHRTSITTSDGKVYDLSRAVAEVHARAAIDSFAEDIRSGAFAADVPFTVEFDDRDLITVFSGRTGEYRVGTDPAEPAGSAEWADTIEPLPDIGSP